LLFWFLFQTFSVRHAAVTVDSTLFPVFLKLDGRHVVVVGGGPVATSKLAGLRAAGARVTVVAPDVSDEIRAMGLEIQQRSFVESDLDDAWYVVAAATPEVNAAVSRVATARRLFVNAVDDPPNATAYLGGVVRRGSATIAISTGGRAPALSGLLREAIDDVLPADLETWFGQADELKHRWRSTGLPMEARRPELAEVIARRYCGTLASCRVKGEEPT
jgi:uroporphyrin-III C-methyltransferase/precorrin-2 dehydrogenase/sirohydrochlorin ferrochelatase